MKSKKPEQPSKEDIKRQKQIEKRIENEKIKLDHPQGEERFRRVIGRINQKLRKKK